MLLVTLALSYKILQATLFCLQNSLFMYILIFILYCTRNTIKMSSEILVCIETRCQLNVVTIIISIHLLCLRTTNQHNCFMFSE